MAESLPSNVVSATPRVYVPPSNLDWDMSLDGPYVKMGQMVASLEADGLEFVRVRWTVTNVPSGLPVLLTGNANVLALEIAIVHARPAAGDWLPSLLITRTAGDATDGEYSEIKTGPGGLLTLSTGSWRVWGRLTTTSEVVVLKAPGYLTVL